jgi:hypothetical protein
MRLPHSFIEYVWLRQIRTYVHLCAAQEGTVLVNCEEGSSFKGRITSRRSGNPICLSPKVVVSAARYPAWWCEE